MPLILPATINVAVARAFAWALAVIAALAAWLCVARATADADPLTLARGLTRRMARPVVLAVPLIDAVPNLVLTPWAWTNALPETLNVVWVVLVDSATTFAPETIAADALAVRVGELDTVALEKIEALPGEVFTLVAVNNPETTICETPNLVLPPCAWTVAPPDTWQTANAVLFARQTTVAEPFTTPVAKAVRLDAACTVAETLTFPARAVVCVPVAKTLTLALIAAVANTFLTPRESRRWPQI